MTNTWGSKDKKHAPTEDLSAPSAPLQKDVLKMAEDFEFVDGELFMETKPFKAWLKRGQAVPASKREMYAEDLLTLASQFYERGGESVTKAVAQLFALAADVMGKKIQESR